MFFPSFQSSVFGGDELKRGQERNGGAKSLTSCQSTQLVLGRTLRLYPVRSQPFRYENGYDFHIRNESFQLCFPHWGCNQFQQKASWKNAMKGKSLQLPGLKSSWSATDLIKILASLVVSTFARIGMILKELDFLVVKELIEPRQSSMRHRKKWPWRGLLENQVGFSDQALTRFIHFCLCFW